MEIRTGSCLRCRLTIKFVWRLPKNIAFQSHEPGLWSVLKARLVSLSISWAKALTKLLAREYQCAGSRPNALNPCVGQVIRALTISKMSTSLEVSFMEHCYEDYKTLCVALILTIPLHPRQLSAWNFTIWWDSIRGLFADMLPYPYVTKRQLVMRPVIASLDNYHTSHRRPIRPPWDSHIMARQTPTKRSCHRLFPQSERKIQYTIVKAVFL